ncbi:MAG: thiosulfate oxidation carrier protein SoxY [Proteobacteria bacterium]|nr:thiosulfate oxidation carrier protein SoxY [Pseudomonadota bacterium]
MTLSKQRRAFLQSALTIISTLLIPINGYARWNEKAYNEIDIVNTFRSIGIRNPDELRDAGKNIELSLPEIAENGAIVPIKILSKIPKTERIFVFAEKNPQPLVSDYMFTAGVEPFIASRIKMGETAFVHVIVLAEGIFYRSARQVKVTIGGCGEE